MFLFLSPDIFTASPFVWLGEQALLQFGFHSAYTPVVGSIINFHNYNLLYLISFAFLVFRLLFCCLSVFSSDNNINKNGNSTHPTNAETIWTTVSAILLFSVFQKKLFLNIFLFIFSIIPTSQTLDLGVFIFNTVETNLIMNLSPFFLLFFFLERKSQIYIFINKMCFYNPRSLNFVIYLTFSLIFSSNHQDVGCMMYSHPGTHEMVGEGFMSILRRFLCIPDDQYETVEVFTAARFPEEAVYDPAYFTPDPNASSQELDLRIDPNASHGLSIPSLPAPPVTYSRLPPVLPPVLPTLDASYSEGSAPYLSSSEARNGLPLSAFHQGTWPVRAFSRSSSSPAEDVPTSTVEDLSASTASSASWDDSLKKKKILEKLNRLLQIDPNTIDYSAIETNFRILYGIQPYRDNFINPESFIVFSDRDGELHILKGSAITEENVGLIYRNYINGKYISVTNTIPHGALSQLSLIETEPTSSGGTRILPMLKIQLPFTPFQEKLFWNISIILLCASGVVGVGVYLPGVVAATQASSIASTVFGTAAAMYVERGLNIESGKAAMDLLNNLETFTKLFLEIVTMTIFFSIGKIILL